MTFLASCSGPEAPSRQAIDRYFEKNPTADKIEKEQISKFREDFVQYVDFLKSTPDQTFDISDNDKVELKNDSTIQDFVQGESSWTSRKWILHGNGDIEIVELMPGGNAPLALQEVGFNEQETAGRFAKIDSKTGGIIAFADEVRYGHEHGFCINKDGEKQRTTLPSYYTGSPEKAVQTMLNNFDVLSDKKPDAKF